MNIANVLLDLFINNYYFEFSQYQIVFSYCIVSSVRCTKLKVIWKGKKRTNLNY